MSGIIGGAGSKSGIIGSTEIPGGYEVGTVVMNYGTSGNTAGTGHAGKYAWYTKTGRVVTISASIYSSSVSGTWSGDLRIYGWPFVPLDASFIFAVQSSGFASGTNFPALGFLHANSTYATLKTFNSGDGRAGCSTAVSASRLSSYDQTYFTVTYNTTP